MRDPMDVPIEPASARTDPLPGRDSGRTAGGWRRIGRSLTTWRRRGKKALDLAPGAFPAARVLQDLDAIGGDTAAASVILARFATLQVVIQATSGVAVGSALTDVQRLARDYLAPGPAFRPGEREALTTVMKLAGTEPTRALVDALLAAGAAAEAWGHLAGGSACYQVAYELAAPRGWERERDAAAHGLDSCNDEPKMV